MAWIWFILLAIAVIYIARNATEMRRTVRTQNAVVNSLCAASLANGQNPRSAAEAYLTYLDNSLPHQDYDKFMNDLCVSNNVAFSLGGGENEHAPLISSSTREALIERLSESLLSNYQRLEGSRVLNEN